MEANREDIAWAAGLFEGEGHVRLMKGYPVAAITSIHIDLLERFRDIIGFGKVYGPYGPYRARQNVFWRYDAHGHEYVQALVAKLWHELTPRLRSKATKVLSVHPVRRGVTWSRPGVSWDGS